MPIDFTQIRSQVTTMGRAIAHKTKDTNQRGEVAFHQFENMPENNIIQERVQLARDRDAGYRGAAPISVEGEAVNLRVALPETPPVATVIAADGSQVYPDIHAAAFYYVTNIATFTFFHGENRLPQEFTLPELTFNDAMVRDTFDQPVTNSVVNARRTVKEITQLAKQVHALRHTARPIVAMFDGRLLFWLGKDVPDAALLVSEYKAAIKHIFDSHIYAQPYNISLIGYIDRPTSRFAISMLRLLRMDPEEVTRTELMKPGEYEGLDDRWLFSRWLQPGERSALLIQQSPQNKLYRQQDEKQEIAFFYLNTGTPLEPSISRVEIPMWVAESEQAVNEVHALVYEQCRMAGRYPYALTRADELAVVKEFDRRALNDLVMQSLLENQQMPNISGKLSGKNMARADRTSFSFGNISPKSS